MRPTTPAAYQLFHDGVLALADVERVGIRIDTKYLENTLRGVANEIAALEEELKQDPIWRAWRKAYGVQANLGSRPQLIHILGVEAGVQFTKKTAKSTDAETRFAADEEALSMVDLPFARKYLACEKKKKLHGTYLKGVWREVCNGRLHCFFNLHTTKTMRGSSDRINFQNIPIRDKTIAKYIRRAFIPDPGCHLVEIDFGSIEVRVSACYNKDPTLIKYLLDDYDMHSDMGAECYKLPRDAVPRPVRQAAKGDFVFASFYGSYYAQTAKALWDDIARYGLTTVGGVPLRKHLARLGITQPGACKPGMRPVPGTFEAHIQKVEDRFWGKRFPVYARWRRDWYRAYCTRGYFYTHTGFTLHGTFSRNDVINYPVQGSAFHCLLWCLIEINKQLKKRKMRARIVGQIHDSIVANVPANEVAEFLALCRHTMVVRLPKHYRWFTLPVVVEAEMCPLDATWFDKEPVKL